MSEHREYKGLEIHAHAVQTADGSYMPRTVFARHIADDTRTIQQDPECDPAGFATEDEAIQFAMQFGIDVIDGHVAGLDLSNLQAVDPLAPDPAPSTTAGEDPRTS